MTDDGPLVAAFRRELAAMRDRPDELVALLRLGLEREALVSVAYRGDSVARRLGRMPIPARIREVAARAIRWIWREEEGHTLWIRGALLGPDRVHLARWNRADPLVQALRGKLMGWVTSRQAHLTWREAPVRRLLAELVELGGRALGEIPDAVGDSLRWLPFREFCAFQADAELTAHLGWARVAELARSPGSPVYRDAAGYQRLADDEARHGRVLRVLAEAFDGDDRAVTDADALERALEAVGQRFVARPGGIARRNPLGKGAPVVVREGTDPDALVHAVLGAVGRPRGATVALKTTLMLVARRQDPSPAVSIRVLRAVVDALAAEGATVRVLDAPNLYDRFRHGRDVAGVARYAGWDGGIGDAQADLVDLPSARGVGEEVVSATWRNADVRVILGKLRTHPTLGFYGGLGASEGLGARHDRALFLDRRTEQATAILRTLDACPPDLVLVDAFDAVPDGLMGFFGDPGALHPRRLYASRDGVALDAVLARHCGFTDADRRLLLHEARDWFGSPSPLVVDGPDSPIPGFRRPDHDPRAAVLSRLAWPVWLLSGDGAPFLPEFDEIAFPARSPGGRRRRALVRRVVGGDRRSR